MTEYCKSELKILGGRYGCETEEPHEGWKHSNKKAKAVWGEGEDPPPPVPRDALVALLKAYPSSPGKICQPVDFFLRAVFQDR